MQKYANLSFGCLAAQDRYPQHTRPIELRSKDATLEFNFLWVELLACEWGVPYFLQLS
jgi:hypothetical protein